MSPIQGLSNVVRLPRLGHIRLGTKEISQRTGNPYPVSTDYFIVPDKVKEVYGEKPRELNIMFPLDDPQEFAPQWLKCYSLTQGLVCRGDGLVAQRKIDLHTGAIANHSTEEWEMRKYPCEPQDCPEYQEKRCRRLMSLQFCLPEVEGLGVWQINTTSRNSILNINSTLKMVSSLSGGRLRFIPLTLALVPIEVTPEGEKIKKVYVLELRTTVKLADLVRIALLPAASAVLEDVEEEEPPEDLYPPEVIAELQEEKVTRKNDDEKPPESPPEPPKGSKSKGSSTKRPGNEIPPEKPKSKSKQKQDNVYDTLATTAEKKEIVEILRKAGETDEGIRAFFNKVTGKSTGWTKSDISKMKQELQGVKPEPPQQPLRERDEIDDFLEADED